MVNLEDLFSPKSLLIIAIIASILYFLSTQTEETSGLFFEHTLKSIDLDKATTGSNWVKYHLILTTGDYWCEKYKYANGEAKTCEDLPEGEWLIDDYDFNLPSGFYCKKPYIKGSLICVECYISDSKARSCCVDRFWSFDKCPYEKGEGEIKLVKEREEPKCDVGSICKTKEYLVCDGNKVVKRIKIYRYDDDCDCRYSETREEIVKVCEYGCKNGKCIEEPVGYCGDGICQPDENQITCPQDCGGPTPGTVCGNGICEPGETWENCPQDCPPPGPTPIDYTPIIIALVTVGAAAGIAFVLYKKL